MLEVTHEGALAVGDIQSLNQRSRNRLQQEQVRPSLRKPLKSLSDFTSSTFSCPRCPHLQSELSEAFSSYCRFLEGGTSGESKSHRAALGPVRGNASLLTLSNAVPVLCTGARPMTDARVFFSRLPLRQDTSSRRYKEIASVMLLTMGGNPVVIKQVRHDTRPDLFCGL